MRRAARLTCIVGAATLVAPAAAFAHADLVDTNPRNGASLVRAPARVVVRFDDVVRTAPGNAAVRNGGTSVLAGKPRTHGRRLVLPLRDRLRDGDYSVRWSAVSDDGHVIQGVLAFSVGTGRAPPPPTLRVTNEVGFGTVFSRWVFFAGLLVGSGMALFDLLVWRPIARSDIRTGWMALALAAMFVSSHGLVRASHGGVATRFGLTVQIASAIAATGAAAAAIAVADRSAAPFGMVLAVLLLPVPTVAGHALDPGRSWLEVPVDMLHVTAAAVWVGGLFALVVIVPREGVPPEIVDRAARRFSTFALAAVIAVGLTGAVRALAELSSVSQLWTTSYGRAILAKSAIFAVLLVLGAVSRATVREGAGRLRNVVRVELVLAVALIVAVAILTSLRPGRS
ncbi:MAG: copper resistance CopC/CopD family protein [Gaiellaceae bacterium]